jgi:hypothetical protein
MISHAGSACLHPDQERLLLALQGCVPLLHRDLQWRAHKTKKVAQCVMHKNVQRSELIVDVSHHCGQFVWMSNVGLYGEGCSSSRFDSSNSVQGGSLVLKEIDSDRDATFCQRNAIPRPIPREAPVIRANFP